MLKAFHSQMQQENGSFCRYRKALYFWSLGISLYLELFCFLSFITIVLRNLCSGTHRRNQENNSSNNKKKQGKGVADYQLTFHCTRFNNHRASLRFQVFPTLQNAPLLFAETGLLFGKCTCLLSAKRGRWIVSKTIQF